MPLIVQPQTKGVVVKPRCADCDCYLTKPESKKTINGVEYCRACGNRLEREAEILRES